MNNLMLKRFITACFSILMLFCVLVPVPCFALSRDVEMVIGETEAFTAPTYTAFTYQWSIESGSGVISIQSGTTSATCKIKAEKVGNAVLHVVYTRTNPLTRSYTNTYKITVSKPSYKVTLDANGGSVYPSTIKIQDGGTINLPTPTRSGYSFVGWFTKADGGNEIHSGEPVTISSDAKLFAHWKAYPSYKVTLDANGGSVYPSSITIKDGDTINLPTPTRSGYSFLGWFTKTNGGNEIHSGDSVTIKGNAKLYAHWKAYLSNYDTLDFEYSVLEDGTAEITGYSGKAERLDIPREIDGIEVRRIGDRSFFWCSSLTSVTIPDSVTTIGDSAFHGCTSLTSVTIPDNVTTIGDDAFACCYWLTSVTIPDSVTTIGEGAFFSCSSLTSIIIPDSVTTIGNWTFFDCDGLTSVTISDGVTTIGEDAFSGCTSLTSVTIPDSVTTIGEDAFSGCSSLTSVTIPDSVTTIGEDAFSSCTSLTSVTIPDSVTTIGDSAFSDCWSLTSVTIPESVRDLGTNPFARCKVLKTINVSPDHPTLTTIGGVLFSKADKRLVCYPYALSATEYLIPQGIEVLGEKAFYHCTSLTSVTIPDSVTTIGDSAFSACSNLTSIIIPDGVMTIGDWAFSDCDSLTSVTIPDGVTTIEKWAFSGCSSLTSVTIPNSVTTIGESAFSDCDSLTSVTISDSVRDLGANPFARCKVLKTISVSPDHPILGTIGGVLFSKVDKRLVCYPYALSAAEYFIPQGIEVLGKDAFNHCESLTNVTIPDSVKTIEDSAFYGCSNLTSVTIPDSATTLRKADRHPSS